MAEDVGLQTNVTRLATSCGFIMRLSSDVGRMFGKILSQLLGAWFSDRVPGSL
jgi:hypothetical protein